MPSIIYGPVTIVDIVPNESRKSCQVYLRQDTATTYGPDETPHLALEQQLSGDLDQRTAYGKRTNTQTLSLESAANLKVGDQMSGHIKRIIHPLPQYSGHKSAYEGGYALTQYCTQYEEDVDLRVPSYATV